ncbi:MAG: hypothetical protein AB8G18_17605 [Gammaproteobacteria bacterium]
MLNNKGVRGLVVASAIMALSTTASFAATQGSTGGNSTGTLDISVDVNDEVRISNLSDITGVFDGSSDVVGSSNACVYRNGTGLYNITASGDGAANAFTLSDGVIATPIPYSVEFNDGTGATTMSAGVTAAGMVGADQGSDTCATTGNNATISVTVAAADLLPAPASTYVGTLTLVVAPE